MCICVEKTPIKVSPLLSKKVVYKRGRTVARIRRPTMVGKVGGMQISDDTNDSSGPNTNVNYICFSKSTSY